MSRQKKRELLNAIKLVYNGHKDIKEQLENDNDEVVKECLITAQENAIQIGNVIEQTEGEGTKTVSLLEEYCELLYQVSISSEKDSYKIYELLNSKMIEIENCFQNEFDMNRLEIAFFPYKAAMWDSLESIWLAASEDPGCDCYVVPIPYFDKHPDGTFQQMYYDGGQFPDYVPITRWEDYNPEDRKPDVIYIHNPYDNGNRVTSIHPDYYSSRLKKYTSMLVYVPYFVVNNEVQEDLCICSGTIYADKVIVQSEEVKKLYIDILEKWIEENNFQSLFTDLNDKFLALGSPKFDKVINTKRETVQIPVEWEKLIYKQDGSRGRVILYNTSIGALLKHKEQMIAKLKSVIEAFKKSDDIILLWRPHPLMESTIASMRPQLLNEYELLVEGYKQEGWGIYDDTPDVHRAIAISDAYYGDESSLVAMYKITGKPIMIQNPNIV